jgi:WD repeat-containing protein 48
VYADELDLETKELGGKAEFTEEWRVNLGKWILNGLFADYLGVLERDGQYLERYDRLAQKHERHHVLYFNEEQQQFMSPYGQVNGTQEHIPPQQPKPVLAPIPPPKEATSTQTSQDNSPPPLADEPSGQPVSPVVHPQMPPMPPQMLNRPPVQVAHNFGMYYDAPQPSSPTFQDTADTSQVQVPQPTLNTSASIMGRLKNFSLSKKASRSFANLKERIDPAGVPPVPKMPATPPPPLSPPPVQPPQLAQPMPSRPSTDTPLQTEVPQLALDPSILVMLVEEELYTDRIHGVQETSDEFASTVGTLAHHTASLEASMPLWLGDYLYRNRIPWKDSVKIGFFVKPMQEGVAELPNMGVRLTANRILRVRKILSYIAERLEPIVYKDGVRPSQRPEEWIHVYCQNVRISPTLTLATIRTTLWKSTSDIVFQYTYTGQ